MEKAQRIPNRHKAYFHYEKIRKITFLTDYMDPAVFLEGSPRYKRSTYLWTLFIPTTSDKYIDSKRYSAVKHLKNMRRRHFFHIVSPSPWPLYTSYTVIGFFIPFAWYLHHHVGMSRNDLYGYFDARLVGYVCFAALAVLCYNLYCWFKDIIKESLNMHTFIIQHCMKQAFLFFIASEVMLFAAFFWAFFHSALVPVIWIGCLWPPIELDTIDPWRVPALNTWILVFSGFTITYAHKAVVERLKNHAYFAFLVTLFLAATFTRLQYWEYCKARFSLYDGIYGSCFYMLTGFHGFHVILGTLMLTICLIRYYYKDFSPQHHVGLVTSIWYWHFVDVIWIGLFVAVYWWGNSSLFDDKTIAKLLLWEKLIKPFDQYILYNDLFLDKKYAALDIIMLVGLHLGVWSQEKLEFYILKECYEPIKEEYTK